MANYTHFVWHLCLMVEQMKIEPKTKILKYNIENEIIKT